MGLLETILQMFLDTITVIFSLNVLVLTGLMGPDVLQALRDHRDARRSGKKPQSQDAVPGDRSAGTRPRRSGTSRSEPTPDTADGR